MTNIFNKYLNINLNDYENIGFDLEINKLLIVVLVGLILATVITNIKRGLLIYTVKKLLRYEALSEESARTLEEMRISSPLVKLELSGETRLKKLVSVVGEEKLSYDEYIEKIKDKKYKEKRVDYKTAKLYISKDNLEPARIIESYNSVTVINTILLCLLYFIAFTSIIIIMPELLSLINNILT